MASESVEKVTVTRSPNGNSQTKTVVVKSGSPFSEFFVSKTNQVIFAFVGIISIQEIIT